jgi:hypothetical protein
VQQPVGPQPPTYGAVRTTPTAVHVALLPSFAAAPAQPFGARLASLQDQPLCWPTSPPSMELVIAELWLPLVASSMGTETPSAKMM